MEAAGALPPVEKFARGPKGPRSAATAEPQEEAEKFPIEESEKLEARQPLEVDPTA